MMSPLLICIFFKTHRRRPPWKMLSLNYWLPSNLLTMLYFCNVNFLSSHTCVTGQFFSNVSWTIANICMEVPDHIAIQYLIFPLELCAVNDHSLTPTFISLFNVNRPYKFLGFLPQLEVHIQVGSILTLRH